MSVNSLDEYWVPEHVKDYLRKLGFVLPLDDMEPWIRSWDAPRNTIRCPVGMYAISIGDTRALNMPSSPSDSIAQITWWYTESRSVLPNRRTTTAFAFGKASMSSTMQMEMNDDFVEPRPPCSQ